MGFIDSFIRIIWNSEGELSSYKKAQLASLKIISEDTQEIESVRSEMIPFDFEVGRICSETFLDGSDLGLYYGILGVIQRALKFGLEHPNVVEELLVGKSKQSDESEILVFNALTTAKTLCDEIGITKVRERAKNKGVPPILELTAFIVNVFETKRPRPKSEILGLRMGHFAVVAEFAFAVGIKIAEIDKSNAEELANEPC